MRSATFCSSPFIVSVRALLRVSAIALAMTLVPGAARANLEEADTAFRSGDFVNAAKLLLPIAENGNARAQYNLGVMFANGQGMARDYEQASVWFERSALQGYAPAQVALGVMYANGQGRPQQLVRAQMWLHLAAAQRLEAAIKTRDMLSRQMTPAQLAEAQKLAREWKPATHARN